MGEAKNRRASQQLQEQAKQLDLRRRFEDLHISFDNPGFYDEPAFLAEEKRNPNFLESYGEWVLRRERSPVYDDHVRSVMAKLAPIITSRLDRHNWIGACFAISAILTRMLDRLGVWNTIVKGSVSLAYGETFSNFAEIDEAEGEGFEQGHAWIIAPPYDIIDLTLFHQRWHDNQQALHDRVPRAILEENTRIVSPEIQDIVAPKILQYGTDDMMLAHLARLRRFGQRFPTRQLNINGCNIRYVPAGISVPDEPLEGINLEARAGVSAKDLWNEDVAPAFNMR